jgi:hypothetical protein
MTKENNKVDFDLSALTLEELIEVYEKIENFLEYLDDSRVEIEEKSGEDE